MQKKCLVHSFGEQDKWFKLSKAELISAGSLVGSIKQIGFSFLKKCRFVSRVIIINDVFLDFEVLKKLELMSKVMAMQCFPLN